MRGARGADGAGEDAQALGGRVEAALPDEVERVRRAQQVRGERAFQGLLDVAPAQLERVEAFDQADQQLAGIRVVDAAEEIRDQQAHLRLRAALQARRQVLQHGVRRKARQGFSEHRRALLQGQRVHRGIVCSGVCFGDGPRRLDLAGQQADEHGNRGRSEPAELLDHRGRLRGVLVGRRREDRRDRRQHPGVDRDRGGGRQRLLRALFCTRRAGLQRNGREEQQHAAPRAPDG